MAQWQTLLQDRWYIVVLAVVLLFIVIKLVKTVIKWVIVLAIIAALFGYGATYMSQIKDKVASAAVQSLSGGMQNARYKKNADGSYTVTAGNVTIQGVPGSNDVKVTAFGQTVTLKIDETIQAIIDQAKKAQ